MIQNWYKIVTNVQYQRRYCSRGVARGRGYVARGMGYVARGMGSVVRGKGSVVRGKGSVARGGAKRGDGLVLSLTATSSCMSVTTRDSCSGRPTISHIRTALLRPPLISVTCEGV